jgi:hypothetical protein
MKKFEGVEVFQPSSSGKGGGASLPFNKGYYQSGNSGGFGIQFTPNGEPNFRTYKSMKHSKKNIKRKMKKFKEYIKEYNITNPVSYNEIQVIDVFFYDEFNGFIRFIGDGKNLRDHFKIYNYGNIATDNFYEEELYHQLVAHIYENIPEGELKDAVRDYYELTPLPEDTHDVASLNDEDIENLELTEDACATMGNTGDMGAIVSAQPSSTPGSVNSIDSLSGSGDIGQVLGTYTKPVLKNRKNKKKIKSFKNFSPIN